MLNILKYNRKSFPVDAIQVTSENMTEVAEWCKGTINDEGVYISVDVKNPLTTKQTQAFVGDWVLKAPKGFKVYTDRAFSKNFEPAHDGAVAAATA